MKWIIMLIGMLLAGCATTESSVKQDSSNHQESCVSIYSSEVGTGKVTEKLTKKTFSVSVIINITKNRLYFGERLEGHDCKAHRSAALWNCAEPNGMIVVGLFDDQTATYRKIYDNDGSVLEFIKPRWKLVSCPE